MTIVNERERRGDNTSSVFTLSATDTNEHDFPDTDGDDSEGGDAFSGESWDKVAAKVYNGQDQDATVRLEATDYGDDTFSRAETVVSEVTVSANGGVETLVSDPDAPFDWYRVVVSFATAPSGNSETEVAFMTDNLGGE